MSAEIIPIYATACASPQLLYHLNNSPPAYRRVLAGLVIERALWGIQKRASDTARLTAGEKLVFSELVSMLRQAFEDGELELNPEGRFVLRLTLEQLSDRTRRWRKSVRDDLRALSEKQYLAGLIIGPGKGKRMAIEIEAESALFRELQDLIWSQKV